MSYATNPSAAQQAREVQAKAIEEPKRRNTILTQVLDELKPGFDELIKSKKILRNKVYSPQAVREELADQFENVHNEQKSSLRIKTRDTKLLLALSAGYFVKEIRDQVLAAVVTSGDPITYLTALVEDKNIRSEDEEDSMWPEENQAKGSGQGAMGGFSIPFFGSFGGGPKDFDQEKIRAPSII